MHCKRSGKINAQDCWTELTYRITVYFLAPQYLVMGTNQSSTKFLFLGRSCNLKKKNQAYLQCTSIKHDILYAWEWLYILKGSKREGQIVNICTKLTCGQEKSCPMGTYNNHNSWAFSMKMIKGLSSCTVLFVSKNKRIYVIWTEDKIDT